MNLKRIMSFLVFFQGIMGGEEPVILPDVGGVSIFPVDQNGQFTHYGATKKITGKTRTKMAQFHDDGNFFLALDDASFYDENGNPVEADFKLPFGLPDLADLISKSENPDQFKKCLIDSNVYRPIALPEKPATGAYSLESRIAYLDLLVQSAEDKQKVFEDAISSIDVGKIVRALSDLYFANQFAARVQDPYKLQYLDILNQHNNAIATTTPWSICVNMLFCGYRMWMSALVWLTIAPAVVFIVGLVITCIPGLNPKVQVSSQAISSADRAVVF